MGLTRKSSFSRPQLLLFAISFGLVGFLIYKSFAAPNPNLPGDLNGDNTVNIQDLSILLSNYGTTNPAADINNDGTVNVLDLSVLLSHYGQTITAQVPSAPTGLTATPGNTSITINWAANPGSEAVDNYQVYWGTDSSFATFTYVPSITSINYTVSGLTNGTTYYFRVSAHNSSGYGPWSTTPISAVPTGGGGTYTPKYYVSPSGNDSNNGTSASSSWKTIAKARSKCLSPGDVVAFEGGQTFSDTYLDISCSGTSASPVVFTSYGTGQARITDGIWFDGGHHDVVLDNLDVSGDSSILIASCGNCSSNPIYNITVQNSFLHNTLKEAIQCNTNDHDWLIKNNTIQHTGDSAIIAYYCNNTTITKNTITDVGYNSSVLGYATHGIYAKSVNLTISYNDFSNIPNGQALSVRTHGQSIYGNTIHDTPYAMAFFDYDTAPPPQGTTYVYYNKFWNISGYAFYYNGSGTDPQGNAPSVSFVIANNTFVNNSSGSEMFNLSEVQSVASITVVNNIFSGTYGSAYRGCGTCSERNNDWFGGASNIPSGSGDLRINPSLSAAPTLGLPSGSALINAGTTNVPGLTYSLNTDGQPLHYAGTAPDMGAAEYLF